MKQPARPLLLEALEPRIAPAGLAPEAFKAIPAGTSVLLKAGEGLSTSDGSGSYLLYVEKGQAVAFTTDLNANSKVDFNEITGIAAGDGLKLLSFTDINGDIVTNLTKDGRLTDSDGNAGNGYDGKIVLNSRIDSVVLRSLTESDLDPLIAGNTVQNRLAKSQYSIFGNIYAGGGLGTAEGTGLLIDSSGYAEQANKYGGTQTVDGNGAPVPEVGFIFTGSAVGGEYFSFGTSPVYGDGPAQSLRGEIEAFVPAAGQSGGDVHGIRSTGASAWHLGGIVTGDGGFGARGGDIVDVGISGDIGGLVLQTGSGGAGETGGNGGSIKGLSVVGSVNSMVNIVTGDGGTGLLGPAGLAGNVAFNGTAQLMGQITVGLGKGGDALGNAGTGTGISSANFESINPGNYLPAQFVSTWRQPGDIGDQFLIDPADPLQGYDTRQIDFDDDGFNDAVVLTDKPDQLFVTFGDDGQFDPARTIYLSSPSYADAAERNSAVVVLDANGDGRPDIVSGQSSGDGYSGVLTFLNRGDDPISGEWLGFATPRYSPLPNWVDLPTDNANTLNTPQAIINLVGGDFNRDGIVDLGLISMGQTSNTLPPFFCFVSVLSGLTGPQGDADGYFAADFGKGADYGWSKLPFYELGPRGDNKDFSFVMKATAAEAGNASTDLITAISRGGEDGTTVTRGVFDRGRVLVTFVIDAGDQLVPGFSPLSYSKRVVNEDAWSGYGQGFDIFGIRAADFVVMDVDNDGAFDAVVVGKPTGDGAPDYLVAATLQGAADGSIEQPELLDDVNFATDYNYYGIALTEDVDSGVSAVLGTDRTDIPVLRMVAGDFDGNPTTADFALDAVDLMSDDIPESEMALFSVTGFGQYDSEFVATDTAASGYTRVGDKDTPFRNALYGYYDLSASQPTAGLQRDPDDPFWYIDLGLLPIAASTLSLSSGAGGSSLLGGGGAGGSIGGGLLDGPGAVNARGFLSTQFVTGVGGFGLTSGGKSGSISGVRVVGYHNYEPANILLATGDAGSALFGAGGASGSIFQFLARTQFSPDGGVLSGTPAVLLSTGAGGFGLTGGAAGSILGRGDTSSVDLADLRSDETIVLAGNGGFGMNSGGAGGSVTNLVVVFGSLGNHEYLGGDGGDSAAGSAGAGGSVSVRPSPLLNNLNGDLTLTAGAGGDGLTGGAGGSVLNFINEPTFPVNPDTVGVAAGDGGQGVTGSGGRGGDVSGFKATADNQGGEIAFVIAGVGGSSAGAVGGSGGSIFNCTLTSGGGAVVAVAGAGGNGLRSGGTGGALTTLQLNSGGLDNARVVAFAGRGGDAYGVSANTVLAEKVQPSKSSLYQRALFTMGPADGLGGTGGLISNFKQPQAQKTSVDLCAGNGGNTVNYGKVTGASKVGRGGSISNVNLANDAGRMDPNVAIRAYSTDFVSSVLDGTIDRITDETGNIGVVVGAAGLVRNERPSSDGVTGSVTGFKARNIMSMVAGSVDRIAAITSVSGVELQFGGTQIGAAKNAYLDPNKNDGIVYTFDPADPDPRPYPTTYYGPPANGTYTFVNNASRGGSLVDGAIVTAAYSGPKSDRVFVVL